MPAARSTAQPLFDDRLFVAFPERRAARSARRRSAPRDIDETRLLLLEDGHCLKDHALAACNRPELRAEATMLGTSLHTIVQMVDNGLGVTMLPEMAIAPGILEHTSVVRAPAGGGARDADDRAGVAPGEPARDAISGCSPRC